MKLKKDAEIGTLLTIKVKDAVGDLYFPESIDDIIRFTAEFDDYRVLAGGSNIIAGKVEKPLLYMGGVISTSDTDDVDEFLVKAFMPSWVSTTSLLDYSVKNGFSGLEFLAGIPGTVGGALYGNAAPAGSSLDDVVGVVDHVRLEDVVAGIVPRHSHVRHHHIPGDVWRDGDAPVARRQVVCHATPERERRGCQKQYRHFCHVFWSPFGL